MLHPSYSDLMKIVNSEHDDDAPVVNSRYSIVMATAKRARQIVAGETSVSAKEAAKPLSTAVKELSRGKISIMPDLSDAEMEEEIVLAEDLAEFEEEKDEE